MMVRCVAHCTYITNIGSFTYVMGKYDEPYHMFYMTTHTFHSVRTIQILLCGLSGAMHICSICKDGGNIKYPTNASGSTYGTDYLDAQPQ